MIDRLDELRPDTRWSETRWAHTREEGLLDTTSKPRLCVACLLPFRDGKPDWTGLERCTAWMIESARHFGIELALVLNADTGYIFQLDAALYREVIERVRAAFPDQRLIAGVTALDADPQRFDAATYHPLLDAATTAGADEAMIMTSQALDALDPEARRDAYFEIAESIELPALAHALEPAFVPWASPFGPWLLAQLAGHPKFTGGKISTLHEPHFLYWAAMCRSQPQLDFLPHSGDDFGIASATRIGLPLLIGAGASACPLICAAKRLWRDEHHDPRVTKLFEAIQSLEDAVFRLDERGSAAAYKHSTAVVLQLLGHLASAEIHPDCHDRRPGDEAERMREALARPLAIARELEIPGFTLAS